MNRSLLLFTACLALLRMPAGAETPPAGQRAIFGKTPDGETVEVFTLGNAHGLRARVMTWGATLIELSVPDREKRLADVTLGFDTLEPYLKPHPFFGSTVGRYANRIAGGKFTIDGRSFTLAANNGPNHLHGGVRGFDKRNWQAEPEGPSTVRFRYRSPDGEEGYPGTLATTVTYTLTNDNALRIDYEATTDAPTIVNLSNHTYWNLAAAGDVLGHTLRIHADHFTQVDATLIPTGELALVDDGPLDFTETKPIGRDIAALKESPGAGYDHNFMINQGEAGEVTFAAELADPKSGRTMLVLTTEPGVQLYTSNHLKNLAGKAGQVYEKHAGVCLETQHFPDSPNHPSFPSTVLRPGETYRSRTVYQFSAH